MRDSAGRLWNLQRIRPDGVKRFLRDGRVSGLYGAIGSVAGHILIAEGWATGMALHLSCQLPCAVAFSAGNLMSVARALHHKYPTARHDPERRCGPAA